MQKKNKFDRVSVTKLVHDNFILFGPQAILYNLESLKAFDFGRWDWLAGLIISGGIFAIKRYMQGEPEDKINEVL